MLWTGVAAYLIGAIGLQNLGPEDDALFVNTMLDGGVLLFILSVVGFLVLAVMRVSGRYRR
jgi:hypothetical protein